MSKKAKDVIGRYKLTRVIKYLRLTISIPLVLGWDGTGKLLWSVDASFAIHDDMRSRTGMHIHIGTGTIYAASIKQKIVIFLFII